MKMQALQNMRPEYGPDCPKSAIDRKNNNDVTICQHYVIVEFFYVAVFPLSSLVSGPSFMSILHLEL